MFFSVIVADDLSVLEVGYEEDLREEHLRLKLMRNGWRDATCQACDGDSELMEEIAVNAATRIEPIREPPLHLGGLYLSSRPVAISSRVDPLYSVERVGV